MNRAGHYAESERLLEEAGETGPGAARSDLIALAHVHATLATCQAAQ